MFGRSGPKCGERSAWPGALTLALLLSSIPAAAQSAGSGQPGPRPLLPVEQEVALARSAAPAPISEHAEVWVLGTSGYSLAEAGTSGAACLVARDWVESLEPVCYDPEGARTVMRIAMRRVELLHAGTSVAETDREIQRAIGAGELAIPRRTAVAYMQSAAQRLIADDGTPVGAWRPHLMLYQPYVTAAELGLAEGSPSGSVVLVDGGAPTAMLMIVVPDAIQPRGAAPPE